ncbi:MAG: hypothetical protein GXP38_17050 [Chloroflexi bacterium]|nr:hypothetical protein [Chloroflexota bacterium]
MTKKTDPLSPSYSLFNEWQSGSDDACEQLRTLFEAAMDGHFDARFAERGPVDVVTVTASLHLLTLSILYELYGMSSAEFYKGDPLRYVRTTLLTQRLLGICKLTLGWPAYAFAAEAMGQAMLYPEGHAPGVDPGEPLATMNKGGQLQIPEFGSDIPRIIEEMLLCFAELTGLEPVAHFPAPYSLAADILGQETLITALMEAPDFVNTFLKHLSEHVLTPWIEHLVQRVPHLWIELSDASGSPLFIGPQRCKTVAAPAVKQLITNNTWGNRVFVANYRGDHHALPTAKSKRQPRNHQSKDRPKPRAETRAGNGATAEAITDLIDFKLSICPDFIIKLEADRVPLAAYVEQAVQWEKPLYLGIGATRIDRSSTGDSASAIREIRDLAKDYAIAIKTVSSALAERGKPRATLAWPGDVYIEDINAETNFNLVQTIVETVAQHG